MKLVFRSWALNLRKQQNPAAMWQSAFSVRLRGESPHITRPGAQLWDDIDKLFSAYEVALRMYSASEEDWGISLWKHLPTVGRDTLLTLKVGESDEVGFSEGYFSPNFGLHLRSTTSDSEKSRNCKHSLGWISWITLTSH